MDRKLLVALVIAFVAVVTVVTLAIGLFTLPLLTPPVDVSSAWRGRAMYEMVGQWGSMIIWAMLFVLFIAFVPFYRESQQRPSSTYLAFIVASAFEMFGIPLSVYIVTWTVGVTLPEGVLWGNTLKLYVGHWGEYVGVVMILIGALFIIFGWKEIYKQYWSKEKGTGKLVTDGIYAFVRHPQYTGLILITLGLIAIWATIPLLIMWPILGLLYYRLAKKEEKEMEKEFGNEYIEYKRTTSMFIPKLV